RLCRLSLFSIHSHCDHRDLHSFPTTTLFRSKSSPQTLIRKASRWSGGIPSAASSKVTNRSSCPTLWSSIPEAPIVQTATFALQRSEEHTSELQSRGHLVCRLLLEKKNTKTMH